MVEVPAPFHLVKHGEGDILQICFLNPDKKSMVNGQRAPAFHLNPSQMMDNCTGASWAALGQFHFLFLGQIRCELVFFLWERHG